METVFRPINCSPTCVGHRPIGSLHGDHEATGVRFMVLSFGKVVLPLFPSGYANDKHSRRRRKRPNTSTDDSETKEQRRISGQLTILIRI